MPKKFLIICVIYFLISVPNVVTELVGLRDPEESLQGITAFGIISAFAQEQITITTYYPSPYGSYRELHTSQMAIGSNYQNTTPPDNSLIVEGNVGIGTTAPEAVLHVNRDIMAVGSNLLLASHGAKGMVVKEDGNVGIGTMTPVAELDIYRGDIYLTDVVDGSRTIGVRDVSGIGGRNINLELFAAGTGAITIPNNNVGIGTTNPQNKLDVEGGVAIGATYSGTSAAPTNGAIIEGNVGIGTTDPSAKLDVEVSSGGAVSIGDDTTSASGDWAVAMGYGANASADYSTAIGNSTTASNDRALAMGYNTIASGRFSTAMGINTTAQPYASFVIGRYNEISGSPGSWVSAEPLFVIGNGSGDGSRSNAMTVRKDGNVGIGMAQPNGVRLWVRGATADANAVALYVDNSVGGELMRIRNDGIINIGRSGHNVDVAVYGNFTVIGGTKNFEVDHPTKSAMKLVHSTLEGPEVGVFYRGKARLVNGEAIVRLPDYFEGLTRKEARTVLLTAKGDEPYLLSASEVIDNKFKVYGTKLDGEFFWEVKAVRADIEPLEVERPGNSG